MLTTPMVRSEAMKWWSHEAVPLHDGWRYWIDGKKAHRTKLFRNYCFH